MGHSQSTSNVRYRQSIASVSSARTDSIYWRAVLLLPSETLDYVIDFLQGDKEALKSCSLTCKDWAFRARYHLFRRILVQLKTTSVYALLQVLNSASILGPDFPSMADNVRIIRLSKFMATEPQLVEALRDLAGYFPHLHILELFETGYPGVEIFNMFQTVNDLRLSRVVFTTPAEAMELLSSFPSLCKVTVLDGVLSALNRDVSDHEIASMLRLRHLPLRLNNVVVKRGLGSWLLKQTIFPYQLDEVQLPLVFKAPSQHNYIMQTHGPTLSALSILFSRSETGTTAECLNCIDLAKASHIRVLRFKNIPLSGRILVEKSCIPELIDNVVSPNLVEVEMMLTITGGRDLDSMDWPGLEAVLAQPRFSSVQCTIDFRNVTHPKMKLDWDELYKMVCQRLPLLHSKGRLHEHSGRRWRDVWW